MSYNATHLYPYSWSIGQQIVQSDTTTVEELTSGEYDNIFSGTLPAGVFNVKAFYEAQVDPSATFFSMFFDNSDTDYFPCYLYAWPGGLAMSGNQILPATVNTSFVNTESQEINLGFQTNFSTGSMNRIGYKIEITKIG